MRRSLIERKVSTAGTVAFCSLALVLLGPAVEAQEPRAVGVEEGNLYPDFLLPDIDGNLGKLSDYRGKKILLFHFASW